MSGYISNDAQQALQTSSVQEQLSQQLPGSFASMSTSYASPQAVQRAQQMPLGPHDPAWFRNTQTSQAHMAAVQNVLSQQHQQLQDQSHQQLQDQSQGAHNDLLLHYQQQDLFADAHDDIALQQQQHRQQQHQQDSLSLQLQQHSQMNGAYDALLLQQQLQMPDDLTQQGLHQQSGLSQEQSLLLLAAQQQLLTEQVHASQLQWDQQQQQQRQLLLAAAAMQPLGATSRALPANLLQQQRHQPEGVYRNCHSFCQIFFGLGMGRCPMPVAFLHVSVCS